MQLYRASFQPCGVCRRVAEPHDFFEAVEEFAGQSPEGFAEFYGLADAEAVLGQESGGVTG